MSVWWRLALANLSLVNCAANVLCSRWPASQSVARGESERVTAIVGGSTYSRVGACV